MAATTALISGLLSAAGGVTGSLLSDSSLPSGATTSAGTYDPTLDPYMSGFMTDALSLIGRGDIGREPDPIQEIAGRIQSLSMDTKLKRRALMDLQRFADGLPSGGGYNASYEHPFLDQPEGQFEYLDAGLSRLGMTKDDLTRKLEEKEAKVAEVERLRKQFDLDGLNARVIGNRANTVQEINAQLGAAADFSRTGEAQNRYQQSLMDRDNRITEDLQDRLGVMANFGNINPGTLFQTLADRESDKQLRLVSQALAASNAMTQTFQGQNATAGAAAQGNAGNQLTSAQIAAQQAQAFNSLQQQAQINDANNFASAMAGAGNALGGAFAMMSAQDNNLEFADRLNAQNNGQTVQNTQNAQLPPGPWEPNLVFGS